ncbi:clostri-philic family protein [Clostridium sp. UBA6640]|nr:clostri-philic family protein [Clostridium sp. UBA6640]
MDKTNNSNNKGKRRQKINNLPKNKGNKKTSPRYVDFDGEPTE